MANDHLTGEVRIQLVDQPANGSITLYEDGTFDYVSAAQQADAFSYKLVDANGATLSTANVSIAPKPRVPNPNEKSKPRVLRNPGFCCLQILRQSIHRLLIQHLYQCGAEFDHGEVVVEVDDIIMGMDLAGWGRGFLFEVVVQMN